MCEVLSSIPSTEKKQKIKRVRNNFLIVYYYFNCFHYDIIQDLLKICLPSLVENSLLGVGKLLFFPCILKVKIARQANLTLLDVHCSEYGAETASIIHCLQWVLLQGWHSTARHKQWKKWMLMSPWEALWARLRSPPSGTHGDQV